MTAEARGSVLSRLLVYTNERFPLPAYIPMILVATFASLGYSRVAGGVPGFPPATGFGTAAFTLLVLFFLLRVADEHKDAEVDRASRPELPVPRGLITLGTLRRVGAVAGMLAIMANALLAPALLLPLGAVVVWMALMTREFFVREWLRRRLAVYLLSHMLIMPLLMLYATAVDWLARGSSGPGPLPLFLAAAYATGLVLETGRKIRAIPDERPGVETYSAAWGIYPAVGVWLFSLVISALCIAGAAEAVHSRRVFVPAMLLALALLLAAALFLREPTLKGAGKRLELASSVWTLLAYGLLAVPWMERR